MRAAVLEGVKRAVLIAGHHDGHRTEVRAPIGIGIGQLGFETEEIPGRPAKDARLLFLIDVAVRVDPVRYPGEPFRRPAASLRCNRHGILSSAPPSPRTGPRCRYAQLRRGGFCGYTPGRHHTTSITGRDPPSPSFATGAGAVLNLRQRRPAAQDAHSREDI